MELVGLPFPMEYFNFESALSRNARLYMAGWPSHLEVHSAEFAL
jgi:hypothetical protein